MSENAAALLVIVGVTPSVFTAPNLTMRLGFLIVGTSLEELGSLAL